MSERTKRAEAGYQRATWEPVDEHGERLQKTAVLSVRMTLEDRDAIIALARRLGVSQGDLVTRKVLGKVSDVLEVRIARIERRIARLERKSYGIALSDAEIDQMSTTEGTS